VINLITISKKIYRIGGSLKICGTRHLNAYTVLVWQTIIQIHLLPTHVCDDVALFFRWGTLWWYACCCRRSWWTMPTGGGWKAGGTWTMTHNMYIHTSFRLAGADITCIPWRAIRKTKGRLKMRTWKAVWRTTTKGDTTYLDRLVDVKTPRTVLVGKRQYASLFISHRTFNIALRKRTLTIKCSILITQEND